MVFDYKKNRFWADSLQLISHLGLTMVGCIAFCFFVGRFIDGWLGTKGLFISIFTILGVLGGGSIVYRRIMEQLEADQKNKNDSKNGVD